MVIKGTSCAGAARIAKHLSCTETNERAELYELRGVAADDLYGALREMEAVALGTRATRPFYHASINTPTHERLSDEQRAHAIDWLEAALGLSGQPRVVVIHRKHAREHCHIVWSRIALETMRVISDSHNYCKHEQVARDLEREFGHARVQGAHVEREGRERPKRTPSHAEMLQAERTGLSVQSVKAAITDIWRRTDSGRAFASALRDAGYVLARGDRRDFVVIDPQGGVHSLARRVEGAKAKDIRARLADLDAARLPSVTEARRFQSEGAGDPRAPVRAVSSKDYNNKSPDAGLRAVAKKKPPARDGPRYLVDGFSGRGIRRDATSAGVERKERGTASPVHYTYPSHYEVRPPKLYVQLKHKAYASNAANLGSGSGTAVALSRAPPSVSEAEQRIGSSRSITASSQAATSREDLTEFGAFGRGNFDEANVELGQVLSAIAEEVYRDCATVCLGIAMQFAARRAFARKALPRNQIAAALAAINAERRAALAAARQHAKVELFGRSQAARALYRRSPPRPAARPKAEPSNWGRAQPT